MGGTDARSHLLRGAHLLVLWSFALPQPIFAEVESGGRRSGLAGGAAIIANAGGIDLVLFALAITFLPPAVLLLVEVAVARAGQRALEAVHLALVVGLAAMIASPIVFRLFSPSSPVQTALALAAGATLGFAYAKLAALRTMATVLVAAPFLFVLFFLFTAPASDVVFGAESHAVSHPTSARAPVVFVLFDEFTSTSLMDSSGRIDAARYPNFARLARDSTWFRNAMADHSYTDFAVPTMLTGKSASPDSVPWATQHPRNLFALLGGYRIDAVEQLTDLCPERLCPERGSFPGRLPGRYKDLVLLGLRAVLPDAASARFPRIELNDLTPEEEVARFLRDIRPPEGRTLDYVHLSLPHGPHIRLPSGKRYLTAVQGAGGLRHGSLWTDNRWLATQGYQRYLLQVGYVDRVLGEILDRLQRAGLYDRAAVVVTADHGVSHRPGDLRRTASSTNLEEIMPVPLFVKAPHQRKARVIDRHVQTVDFLPSLWSVLSVRPPSGMQGRSGFDPGLDRQRLTIQNPKRGARTIAADELDTRRAAVLRGQTDLFGIGGDPERIYEVGLDRALRGRRAATLPVTRSPGLGARILEPASFEFDPRGEIQPARLAGRLTGSRAGAGIKLVIALNGRIWASTQTYAFRGGVWFSAILPPSRFRPGSNTVEVFAPSGSGRSRRLVLLARKR